MNSAAQQPSWLPDYEALTQHAGFVPLDRTQIELSGKDRASFLHNLSTNEVKKLAAGAGCEAFITSVQGKTLGHGFIFAEPEALVLDTVAGQSETLLKHLDHYLVCEQVVLADRSQEWFELLLAGADAEAIVARLWQVTLPELRLSHATVPAEGRTVRVRRVDMTPGSCFLVNVSRDDAEWLKSLLSDAGVRACAAPALEAARIEQGTPYFGQDLGDKNLPQELGRDNQAISFIKGCYLGQETVARLDALGHVNKSLVGVRFAATTVPEVGSELRSGDQVVGQVTSATYSPQLGAPLALAYVRAGHNQAGTRLSSVAGEAEVVGLPVR
jgi:tRNA-modifying protein YgfZ